MCDICLKSICPSGCPNFLEPPIVCYCDECKEPIYDGDMFYRVGRTNYCEECMEGFKQYAEVEDYWED